MWSLLVILTGGFSATLGPIRLSSRNPRNPAIIALVCGVFAWAAAPAGSRRRAIAGDVLTLWDAAYPVVMPAWSFGARLAERFEQRARLVAVAIAAVTALAIVYIGFTEEALVAASSDAYGYASQAHLWATRTLIVDQPLMRELSAQIPREATAPLAHRPAPDRMAIVPVTPPGLPLLMAFFEIVAGRDAIFWVVPLMAGVAIWATYLLGRQFGDASIGAVAAVLLATSPSFLFQLTSSPMSDIPVTAWWALALTFTLRASSRVADLSRAPSRAERPVPSGVERMSASTCSAVAGVCAGAAIVTRPNLLPLVAVPCALLVWDAVRQVHSDSTVRGASHSLLRSLAPATAFVMAIAPACAFLAALYDYWYGSPLSSGYGTLEQIYSWTYVRPNLARYPRWLMETQTPIVLLAAVAPVLARNRAAAIMLLSFIATTFGCYVFYVPFDAWWFLRFLLPSYPALLVLTSAMLLAVLRRLPVPARTIAIAVSVAWLAWHGFDTARARATFTSEGELKYAITGRYVADHLPPRAVLVSEQHSGSTRYYSERITLRFSWIPASMLDWTIDQVRGAGYEPYVLVEDWEEVDFRAKFRGARALASLDRAPVATLPLGNVRIYRVD